MTEDSSTAVAASSPTNAASPETLGHSEVTSSSSSLAPVASASESSNTIESISTPTQTDTAMEVEEAARDEKPTLSAGQSILPSIQQPTEAPLVDGKRQGEEAEGGHHNGSDSQQATERDGEPEVLLSSSSSPPPASVDLPSLSQSTEGPPLPEKPSRMSISSAAATEEQTSSILAAMSRPEAIETPVQPAQAATPSPPWQPQAASLTSSSVFILSALDQLLASKDAKGSRAAPKALREAAESARDLVKAVSANADLTYDPRAVFEPFRLACDPSRSTATHTIALDCIGKMVSYAFFAGSPNAPDGQTLPDVVIMTICQLPPSSPPAVTLQQLKALLALVLAGLARQSALLQAVRTAYDVFLLAKDPSTQAVAQGVLTQMCSATFGRIKLGEGSTQSTNASEEDGSPPSNNDDPTLASSTDSNEGQITQDDAQSEQRVTLREMESRASFDQAAPGINLETNPSSVSLPNGKGAVHPTIQQQGRPGLSEEEILIKDAFLVLRALCKLSMKPLTAEAERDLRSHGMRSKLLSLHLILGILTSHIRVFNDPAACLSSSTTGERTPLVQAVKQYLCLSLSRNAVSPVNQVFEVACEIFWVVLNGLRTKLKKEIEVLLNEIFLPILEMKTSTAAQKSILLTILGRLCRDPQALVEIYLNYDCDRTALDNVYERLITIISKMSQAHISQEAKDKAREAQISAIEAGEQATPTRSSRSASSAGTPNHALTLPPALNSGTLPDSSLGTNRSADAYGNEPLDVKLKRQSLDCLCAVLRSLVVWSQRGNGGTLNSSDVTLPEATSASASSVNVSALPKSTSSGSVSLDAVGLPPSSPRGSVDLRGGDETGSVASVSAQNGDSTRIGTPESGGRRGLAAGEDDDDPTRFQDAKQRKTTLLEGIQKFNFKPKRGIEFLLQHGFLRSKQPEDIARFLLYADGLNKAQVGEYLGEGEPENVAIMHAFVDLMEFDNMPFTSAMRRFLQAFRLPGESQKIDRFMLKFAERYVAGNPGAFANADTAYVLAYSVILLNTDAHNPQVKHRMTLKGFLRNNEGIDDGKSLSDDFLESIYDEIQTNEIKMKDEQLAAATVPTAAPSGLAGAIATVGRDLQREAYVLQSEGMASKTEALFRTMLRAQRRIHPQQRAAAEQFFSASHFEHVRPMFSVAWMAFLAGVSSPLQESDEEETIARCLGAFKDAIHIACLFGMELERNAFLTTLAKFTFLNNLGEMKSKNVEAIKTLLGVAQTEGNYLKGSWRDVLACVGQLERFQLISGGVDERQLPDLGRRTSRSRAQSIRTLSALPDDDVVQAGGSTEVTIAADMVFSSSARLSGEAIVDFVQCLAENSWEEIMASGMTDHPRLFSLQKLVEISYYNMGRIRLEWSSIWNVLGEHFNQVCTHPNPRVSSFALDSLRQLANRFLELEELANFKFQKDFLKPFEYTMRNTSSTEAKEMVLSCLHQMILSRIQNMRSGWRTLFGTLGAASKSNERVATNAFELVRGLYNDHFNDIILAGAFADLTVCLTEFAKATQAQKIALRSVELLGSLVPAMLASPVCPLDPNNDPGPAQAHPPTDDPMVRFWFPSLFAFYDVIMNGDDLEVRRVALDCLFDILTAHGSTFRPDFWATVCQEVIFPIFAVLRSSSDVSKFSAHEDMSVWLSTTMIQALRNLITLWTHYFETLQPLLSKLLSLLCACICQENDTLARIGTSCLQSLLENNVRKLSSEQWTEVIDTFLELFRITTAHQLFDSALRAEHVATSPTAERSRSGDGSNGIQPLSPGTEAPNGTSAVMSGSERRRAFKQIIVKCVLQLLLIETTHSLLDKPVIYELIPPAELLRLTQVLETSYRFSKKFNADKDLRMSLWKVGFMKQLPNLLKQESSSAATLINVLVRLHGDTRWSHRSLRAQVRGTLVPLGEEVVNAYLPLDPETQARNVAAWTPVVADVFRGICTFHDVTNDEEVTKAESSLLASSDKADIGGRVFTHHAKIFYPLAVDLLSREPLPAAIGESLRTFFYKVGIAQGMIDEQADRDRRRRIQEGRDQERGLRTQSTDNSM